MKNRLAIVLGSLLLLTTFMVTGCADPCKDVVCNSGTCVDGGCICDAGYEGINCDTRMSTKFVATYNVDEVCTTGNFTYTLSISESTSEMTKIWIDNLYDVISQTPSITTDASATIDVATGTGFTFSGQMLGTAEFAGTGTIDESTGIVTIVYTLDGGATDSCTAVCTPQ